MNHSCQFGVKTFCFRLMASKSDRNTPHLLLEALAIDNANKRTAEAVVNANFLMGASYIRSQRLLSCCNSSTNLLWTM